MFFLYVLTVYTSGITYGCSNEKLRPVPANQFCSFKEPCGKISNLDLEAKIDSILLDSIGPKQVVLT